MHKPHAQDGGVLSIADDCVRVDGIELSALAAFVWAHADGTRDTPELRNLAERMFGEPVDAELIWFALDSLADAGLLRERHAPPMGGHRLSRRDVLHAAALLALGSLFPRAVTADTVPAPTQETAPTPAALTPAELAEREQRLLEEARAARLRGDDAVAAEKSAAAKEMSRERTNLEQSAEQDAKTERSQRFDAARQQRQPPPTAATAPAGADGATGRDAEVGTQRGLEDLDGTRAEPPAAADAQGQGRQQQEQELKNAQERNIKRIHNP